MLLKLLFLKSHSQPSKYPSAVSCPLISLEQEGIDAVILAF